MSSLKQILKQYWNYDSFRPQQEEIINSVLKGQDVLALLPAAGGKSICFQVAALAKPGMCLVISPLVSLMKDQVERLRAMHITAFAIDAGMSRIELGQTLELAARSNCKFLYLSAERLETSLFKEWLPAMDIQLIAVDEAHCISQWGYDFRPAYLRIAVLRADLPGIPVLALTASATKEVQEDICNKLEFEKPQIFRESFERGNLSYSCYNVSTKSDKILDILQKLGGSGIVYCKTRRRTHQISKILNGAGIQSDFYHAGLSREERAIKQDDWKKNRTRIIVCTNAFGMGIDKPDVQIVIHADVPDAIEHYYQESGRAGRDGKRAYAVLLYDEPELDRLATSSVLRFPPIENIRKVYRSIMNYLQIPAGTGEGSHYDFDLDDCINKFELDPQLLTNSMSILEQEGWFSFNERVFIPSRIVFTVDRNRLIHFENEHPQLEPLGKLLLRSYPGIFDQESTIQEIKIAKSLHLTAEALTNNLRKLHKLGILQYSETKDAPQLFLMQDRVEVGNLRIDEVNYRKRKSQYEKRITSMLNYVKEDRNCRSQQIAAYFGDELIQPCGICDHCLNKKKNN